ncbi:MAG: AAC(3) family N-acetyltransferase [Crocinitomicaceae bacterium]|nr:AAC(3) family N-acetyltransferase [Crocinitomicaceae bacterium]
MNILKNIKSKLGNIRTRFRKNAKLRRIKQGETISLDQLITDFREAGLTEGDKVFVHSSLSKIGFVEGGAETIINALKEVITPKGTILFPAFCFPGGGVYDTIANEDYIFDVRTEPSYVGKISEVFRHGEDVVRSYHPTHSITAWGKDAEDYVREHVENGTWGAGTPFGKMLENNVTMIGLGVPLPMFTFFHCVEDYNLDLFPGLYTSDKLPVKIKIDNEIKTFHLAYHDPEFTKNRIEKDPEIAKYFTNFFLNSGKLEKVKIGNADSLLITAQDFYDLTLTLAKKNCTIYKVNQE